MTHSHPAFPSLPPGTSGSSSRQIPSFPPPSTSTEVVQLLNYCTSLNAARDLIVPLLQQTADGVPFGGAKLSDATRMNYGEKALALEKEDIYNLPDDEVQRLTAALIYIVSARLTVSAPTQPQQIEDILTFAHRICTIGDAAQLQYCAQRLPTFAWSLLRLAQKAHRANDVVTCLSHLIQRSCYRRTFTGVFAAFLEGCLLSRNYAAAPLVLDQVFLDVYTASPNYLDVLTYHHHAGLISAAVMDYAKAKQYFVKAVTLPTQTTSAIQLAAAKRAYLCELLDTGKRLVLPKYTPNVVTRVVERNAQAYVDLAKDYEAQQWDNVRKHADQRVFDQDCNRGLVDRILNSIVNRKIIHLQKIYSKLTLDDLAFRVGLKGQDGAGIVHTVVDDMVRTGVVSATVTPGAKVGLSIVSFVSGQDYIPNMTTLANGNYKASMLEAELVKASKRAGLSKEYLRKQVNMLENSGKVGGGGRAGRGDDFDQMMAAEDAFDRPKKGVGANYNDMGF